MSIESIKYRATTIEYSCWDVLNGDCDTTQPAGWWHSDDGQGGMDMRADGEGGSLASALADMLEQAAHGHKKSILDGTLTVQREEERGEDLEDIGADDARPASRWIGRGQIYIGGNRSKSVTWEIDLEGKTMAEAAAYLRKMCASEAEVEEIEGGTIFVAFTKRESEDKIKVAQGKLKMYALSLSLNLFDEEEEEEEQAA